MIIWLFYFDSKQTNRIGGTHRFMVDSGLENRSGLTNENKIDIWCSIYMSY